MLQILNDAVALHASDIFITAGKQVVLKVNGNFVNLREDILKPNDTQNLITELYSMVGRTMEKYLQTRDDDFSVSVPGLARFRVNTYFQRSSMTAVIRVVNFEIPDYREKNIPEYLFDICKIKKGLVLVTGPAGSGKSTTLACMIDKINTTRQGHIITIEDPIEYLHKNKKCIVSQRELFIDTSNYSSALRASLRQSPDVIFVGEMRDLDTMQTALTASETGHLILSTLHTSGTANTITRIIDMFPEHQQQQVRMQLSDTLKAVVYQQLIETDMGLVPAFEILKVNDAVRNLIRSNKIQQIETVIYSSETEGMIGMDAYLLKLYKSEIISKEILLDYAVYKDLMLKKLKAIEEG